MRGKRVSESTLGSLPELLGHAVSAHQAGHLDVAYPLYQNFLDQHPAHPLGLQLFGLLHSQRGDDAKAIAYMRESLRLFPEQPEVANNLGNALKRAGRPAEAIDSYRRACELQPRYCDAWRNLGLCLVNSGRVDEAEDAFRRCLEVEPKDAAAWLGIGAVAQQRRQYEDAAAAYREALVLKPDYADAHHNLGVCLRQQHRPEEALGHYRSARELGLDHAALHHNMGNALSETGDAAGAIDAYWQAVERDPGNVDSHRNLNSLLWQHERLDDYLSSYAAALERFPAAFDLRIAWAAALNQQERHAKAEAVLREGLKLAPESGELLSTLAYSLEQQQRWDEALAMHASAVAANATLPNHNVSYARALLATGRPDEALEQARTGAAQTPFDQRALAYLSLCWRLLGDPRDGLLNDYDALVRVYELPVPAGFGDIGEFNDALTARLEPLHIAKRHPAQQTLRHGSQTGGDLFVRQEPEIRELADALETCVRDYVGRFPANSEHPLYSRRRDTFHFATSWSVRLAQGGFHTNHVHPLGWISSAYYVQIPAALSESDTYGGGLQFGTPDIDIGTAGAARRRIQPVQGRLVLFPSYMWHGTVPFDTPGSRLSVAFDVVPSGNAR
ncbi:MAG: tetratricopeptide repeat protein [Pseudomonadota bacterium]